MKRIRWALPVLLAIGVAASGCVYWRLLQFKKQFNSFDEHFEFRSESTYSLVIREPVLTGADFDWLMEVEPTRRHADSTGTWRIYEFEKHPPDDSPPLVYGFRFVDELLVEIRFPDQLGDLYPAPVMRDLLSSLGKARVEKRRKSVRSRLDSAWREHLPGRDTVLASLGDPSRRDFDEDSGGEGLFYRYRLRTITVGEKERKRRAYGNFHYDPDGSLRKLETGIGKHELSINLPDGSNKEDSDARRNY